MRASLFFHRDLRSDRHNSICDNIYEVTGKFIFEVHGSNYPQEDKLQMLVCSATILGFCRTSYTTSDLIAGMRGVQNPICQPFIDAMVEYAVDNNGENLEANQAIGLNNG